MPFDPISYAEPKVDLTELQPGREGLEQLSYLLRHPEEWPKGHVWDFHEHGYVTDCGTVGCALGVAKFYWGAEKQRGAWRTWDRIGAGDIFRSGFFERPDSEVTPPMVADAIDFYLREGRVPMGGEASNVA